MVRSAAESDPTVLVLRRTYGASPHQVFAAWTKPELVEKWLSPGGDIRLISTAIDFRQGGSYRFAYDVPDVDGPTVVTGVYRTIIPNEKLTFTWVWERHPLFQGDETLVTVEFNTCEQGTQLVLTHERFPNDAMRTDHQWGWTGAIEQLVLHCRLACRSIPDGQRPL